MIRLCAWALLALPLAGCGQKGPLYMPDSGQGEVVTRPAGSTTDGGTSAPSNPPPAPEVSAPADTPAVDSQDPESKDKGKKQAPK